MAALAGSLYLLSTAAFSLLAILIGVRLFRLSRRTGRAPERSLGLGIALTAGLGYGLLMSAVVARQTMGAATQPIFAWIMAAGWIFHNTGVMFILDFVRRVFRPEESWAGALWYTMALVLWGGSFADMLSGGLTATQPGGFYWVAFSVIGTYPIWTGAESFRYWQLMRRRVALGLAEPLVANRFLLWSIASACTVASIWMVNAPIFLGYEPGSEAEAFARSISMLITSAFGIATICTYWLTFFPPAWYSSRFPAGASRLENA
ncbi:MAG: hypothetical protein JRG95_09130 [Deltaproteobacteria bacterium]|nr:hypothetical protein [Deltaproteobacteria bacterium]